MIRFSPWILLIISTTSLFFAAGQARCDITYYEVGTGDNQAQLALHFSDDAQFVFNVNFTDTTTGLGLFDIIEAELALTTQREDFGYGIFIDGISFDGHGNLGYGGDEDWWHYWIKDTELDPWESSAIGVTERIVQNGCWDGWRYGSEAYPIPEPSSLFIIVATGIILFTQKRH